MAKNKKLTDQFQLWKNGQYLSIKDILSECSDDTLSKILNASKEILDKKAEDEFNKMKDSFNKRFGALTDDNSAKITGIKIEMNFYGKILEEKLPLTNHGYVPDHKYSAYPTYNTDFLRKVQLYHSKGLIRARFPNELILPNPKKVSIIEYSSDFYNDYSAYWTAMVWSKYIDWLALVKADHNSKKQKTKKPSNKTKEPSLKAIAIVCFVTGEDLNENNYNIVLRKYGSKCNSKKILQKRIHKTSNLINASGNKTADTKHLNTLNEAKRLLSGINNQNAITTLNSCITAFQNNFNKTHN